MLCLKTAQKYSDHHINVISSQANLTDSLNLTHRLVVVNDLRILACVYVTSFVSVYAHMS